MTGLNTTNKKQIKPFLKWAGGKRWLINRYAHLFKDIKFTRYFEPFLGSGALFFFFQPKEARLSDINPDLIILYKVIKNDPEKLLRLLRIHHRDHSKDHYYRVRSKVPDNPIEKAARILYLNRTCWNGLYRVNAMRQFNVPIGTKTSVILPTDDFISVSSILSTVELECCDFEESINMATAGDFVFIDPPYTVQHNNNNFLKYNENIFSWDDQVRLKKAIVRAMKRGVKGLVTNANHPSIIELYKGIGDHDQLIRSSILAANKEKRGLTTEALFKINF